MPNSRKEAMTRVEKIEQDIRALTDKERSALRAWFFAYDADLWDRQIEADAAGGKLDRLGDAAIAEYRQGKTKPL
jgi:hypothetical protein